MWKARAKGSKVHMAFIDLHKAYDSVDRPTLWRVLKEVGIQGEFLSAIQAMYKGDSIASRVGSESTRPVYLRRGVRQGLMVCW